MLAIGIALGSVPAVVASDGAWHKGGRDYDCRGGPGVLLCKEAHYRFALLPSALTVSYGDEVIFECARTNRAPRGNCRQYAPSRLGPKPDSPG